MATALLYSHRFLLTNLTYFSSHILFNLSSLILPLSLTLTFSQISAAKRISILNIVYLQMFFEKLLLGLRHNQCWVSYLKNVINDSLVKNTIITLLLNSTSKLLCSLHYYSVSTALTKVSFKHSKSTTPKRVFCI